MKTSYKQLDELISLKNRIKHNKTHLKYITECIDEVKKSSGDPYRIKVSYDNHYLTLVSITKEQVINNLEKEKLKLTTAILEIQDEIIAILEEK
ncbi:TPA: hypothetical protein IXR32_002884 [Enterococcus faecium]|nr:hypothetical protein [Enterococcus faecium]